MLSKIKKTKKWWGTSKKFEGSAIIVTFFVMMLILTTALSLALVTIKDMKASIGASKSNFAYQAADEGIEEVMNEILNGGHSTISQIMTTKCHDELIWNNNYIVEFLDELDQRINCNSGDPVSTIINIKSIGVSNVNAQKSERAVRVPVPSPSP